jgi:anti-sigma factor ChrR (cupin superfamily)
MQTNFNMDFSKSIVINTSEQTMVPSPSNGVSRIPLERESAESGWTTSIVEYHAGTSFPSHPHPGGEEIFVLEGIFSDEFGDYPAGTYLRNPPGHSHAPFSKEGCVIFVKLNQFKAGDTQKLVIDTTKESWRAGHGNLEVMPLANFETEGTALVKWPKGEKFIKHSHFGGEEILVLSGIFKDEHGEYPKGTWLRSKHLSSHHPWVDEETLIFVKTGHL